MATTAPGGGACQDGAGGVRLEIAAQDVDGATTAVARGADRLEVCQALAVGGLTPSAARRRCPG